MRIRLRCRIFGHDFRIVNSEFNGDTKTTTSYAVDYCRHCGLSKKEIIRLEERK